MSTTLKLIQEDAEKLVAQKDALESRIKSLDSQISGRRVELRKLEEQIESASKTKKETDAQVAKDRAESITAIDKRNSESEQVASATKKGWDELNKDRREFEEERAEFVKFQEEKSKLNAVILGKFSQVKQIIG